MCKCSRVAWVSLVSSSALLIPGVIRVGGSALLNFSAFRQPTLGLPVKIRMKIFFFVVLDLLLLQCECYNVIEITGIAHMLHETQFSTLKLNVSNRKMISEPTVLDLKAGLTLGLSQFLLVK